MGYQTAVVAPAPGLVVIQAGIFLQGKVNLGWYQEGRGIRAGEIFPWGGTQGTDFHIKPLP